MGPDDCLSFMSMMITDDGSMYKMPGETLNPHTDVAVMPYSSGTTGPAKGVCLTHYNLVANCCQVSSPEVSDVRPAIETGFQEITLAVLPFFHIYAMTTIMVMGLHLGHKIVTVPKFEPDMYIKALINYHRNKRATKDTVKDGWLLTGDVARYREDGQFVIVDRLKALIKVKGYQVAPSELEDLIRKYEGVVDVAVTGVPDEMAGELPRAYVIRKNRKVHEGHIMKFVASHVAPHKKLGGVMMVDSLPRNQ